MKKAVFQQKAPSGLRTGLFAQDSWPLRLQNEQSNDRLHLPKRNCSVYFFN